MIDSDQRLDSNRRPLLKSAFTDVIISNHIDLRIGSRFENLNKGHRSEVQMSVTYKSDKNLRIGNR